MFWNSEEELDKNHNLIVHGFHFPISVHKILHYKGHIGVNNIIDTTFFVTCRKKIKRDMDIKKSYLICDTSGEKICKHIFNMKTTESNFQCIKATNSHI